jgi:protein O-GlcNAc transferase
MTDRASLSTDTAAALRQAKTSLQQGRLAEAEAICRRVLIAFPDLPEVLHLLGISLLHQGDAAQAAELIARSIAIDPSPPAPHSNLGIAWLRLRRTEDALASFDRALRIKPDYPEALNNRGGAWNAMARLPEAIADFSRVLAITPDHVGARINRGNALRRQQRLPEALADFDEALRQSPDHPEAIVGRGITLQRLKRPVEALACYDRALQLRPGMQALQNNRGAALRDLKRYDEAADAFAALAQALPDYDYAVSNRLHSQLYACDWRDYDALVARVTQDVIAGRPADVPFSFLAISRSPAAQLACARDYAARHYPGQEAPRFPAPRAGERIRLAYLSADFHEHATAYLMAGLFEAHDRGRFETFAISFGPDTRDAMRQRLERAFDRFVDVSALGDDDVARMLRELGIDILIDLKGFTADNRAGILALRPAPVQVNYLGYPGTMGAPYIDYLIADPVVLPPAHESFYQEAVIRLPDCYQCNDDRRVIATPAPTRAQSGLPENGVVLCCFNNNYKIAPDVFDVWMRLLAQVEGSVLWLFEDNAVAAGNLRRQAERRGIAAERLVFAPRLPPADHLARHACADLFLDTLPYNAHTTASDALWAGLPVVTCLGEAFAGRVAASLLQAIGLPELVTHDRAAYEALALALATDPARRQLLRERIARQRSTSALFDTDRFRRHIEHAYTTIWQRHHRGEPPAGFDVMQIA